MTERTDISRYAVRLGDDALILGHRVSEWTSRAPFLEEDLAVTNVALDYVGRARMFYQYAAELEGGGHNRGHLRLHPRRESIHQFAALRIAPR